jgi:chlorite dismutase
MSEPLSPTTGMAVLHLFCHPAFDFDAEGVVAAVKHAQATGVQVISVSMLGHKCDLAFMAIASDLRDLRKFQSALQQSGVIVADSYVSLTEVSEYAAHVPPEMLNARLYPQLPPPGKLAWCFYPMSKRRDPENNWFTLPFEKRSELMMEHGKSGRTFSGRITQLVTGSAGVDDYEWGVTLFGVHPDDLKDVVYTMRFDEASAKYADFGTFYVGMVTPIEELVLSL